MVGDAETPVTFDATRLKVDGKVRIKSGRLEGREAMSIGSPTAQLYLPYA